MCFTHLHVHTEYSLLDGVNKIALLMQKTKDLGMDSIAMTDHGVMYGLYEFWRTAKDIGIKPLIGCEIYLSPISRFKKEAFNGIKYYHLVLIASNLIGYKNLIKLVSTAHLEGMYYKPRADKETLEKYSEGLICTSACLAGPISKHILRGEYEIAEEWLIWLKNIFKNRFFIELQRHGYFGSENLTQEEVNKFINSQNLLSDEATEESIDDLLPQKVVNIKLLELAEKHKLPIVASSDVHYLNKEDKELQSVLFAIKDGKKLSDSDCRQGYVDTYLLSPEEIKTKFSDIPDAISNTLLVRDMVEEFDITHQRVQPKFWNTKPNIPTNIMLKTEAYIGAVLKYGKSEDHIRLLNFPKQTKDDYLNIIQTAQSYLEQNIVSRIELELEIIHNKGYDEYFLVVSDIMKWAAKQNILVGVRGSVAGSVVAYCLEIVEVEPIKWELYFERFLNPERPSPPDIDMDIQDSRRDEILKYVEEKYGKECIAAIITMGRFKTRAVIRDICRVLGVDLKTADKLSKMVTVVFGKSFSFQKMMETNQEFAETVNSDPNLKKIGEYYEKLENLSRHVSVHACGHLITPEPIVEYVPVQLESGGERVITQLEFEELEAMGLMKFDFLGLKTLTVVANTLKLINLHKDPSLNYQNIPLDDKDTFNLFTKGQTIGVFQFESAPMRTYLKSLKPETLEDLCFMAAAYRPGPMEYIPDYIKRKHGLQDVQYLVPKLKNIVGNTFGFAIYQEQVIKIAVDLAGYSMGEADILRRAMGKKKKEIMEKEEAKFKERMQSKGYTQEIANQIWEYLKPFADYGFNKAHAAGYAVLAFKCGYLKTHYPLEFMTALLESHIDDRDKIATYLNEIKSMGFQVLPPSVNKSDIYFTPEEDYGIRYGLGAIKNVGEKVCEIIVEERRKNGQYKDLIDFVNRHSEEVLNKRVIEALVKSGAMDEFGERNYLLKLFTEINKKEFKIQSQKQVSLFGENTQESVVLPKIKVESATDKEKMAWELEFLGIFLSTHPLENYHWKNLFKEFNKIENLIESENLTAFKIVGFISNLKIKQTKSKGEKMAVFDIEDETGKLEGLIFPSNYKLYSNLITEYTPLILEGKINKTEESLSLQIEKVEHINILQPPKKITINLVACRDTEVISKLRSFVDLNGDLEVKMIYGSTNVQKEKVFKIMLNNKDAVNLISSFV